MYDYEILGVKRSNGSFVDKSSKDTINYDNINFYIGKPITKQGTEGVGFEVDLKSCMGKCKYNLDSFRDFIPKFDGGLEDFYELVGARCEPCFDSYGHIKVLMLPDN